MNKTSNTAGHGQRLITRRRLQLILAGAVAALAVALTPGTASASQAYTITANGVALRAGPGTGYALLGRLNAGAAIQIDCQVQRGTSIGGNATWDRLTGGQWVGDYYTSTPSFNSYAPGLRDCNTPPPATGSGSGALVGLAGKCVDVRGGQATNSTAVQLYDCNGTAAQGWTWTGNTLRALGKCLDAAGGRTGNGTPIQLYDCNGTGAQTWQPSGNALRNPQSGRCLDVPGGNSASGSQLQLWDCNGTAAQVWKLTSQPTPRAWGRTEPTNSADRGQCTWGAKERFRQATGVYPAVYGNAKDYAASARNAGWTIVDNAQARSIVVLQPGVHGANAMYGHVAWVDSVESRPDGLYVHVTEMNGAAGLGRWSTQIWKDVPGMSYILAP